MLRRPSRSFGACIALGLTACTTDQAQMTRPPAPPLVQDALRASPPQPVSVTSPGPQSGAKTATTPRVQEPAGKLTLQQALSLALLGNPELAPFSIEIRAAEARTLQADRPPNPDVEFLAEDFGGTGRAKHGFTGSQETLALGQVV